MSEYEKLAEDFCAKTNTKINIIGEPQYKLHFQTDKVKRFVFKVRISRNGKSFTINFGQSYRDEAAEPTKYTILSCLQKYDVGSYKDFCAEFGYEEYNEYGRTNKETAKVYKNVTKEFENVDKLFSDVIEELSEIN